jgi:hypothetical protein
VLLFNCLLVWCVVLWVIRVAGSGGEVNAAGQTGIGFGVEVGLRACMTHGALVSLKEAGSAASRLLLQKALF